MAKDVTLAEQQEDARAKHAQKSAQAARQQELDRRDAMRKAQAKATQPPLVRAES